MTNLAVKTEEFVNDAAGIHTGDDVALFTSGSMPAGSDMMAGDLSGAFTTSCIETLTTGAQTGLFTTSCDKVDTSMTLGGGVALFTTSC